MCTLVCIVIIQQIAALFGVLQRPCSHIMDQGLSNTEPVIGS